MQWKPEAWNPLSLSQLCSPMPDGEPVSEFETPYTIVELPSEEVARQLQERCIMADKVQELWGHGT